MKEYSCLEEFPPVARGVKSQGGSGASPDQGLECLQNSERKFELENVKYLKCDFVCRKVLRAEFHCLNI